MLGVISKQQLLDICGGGIPVGFEDMFERLEQPEEAITEAGALSLDVLHHKITGPTSSTYAVTLAAPTRAGQLKIIEMVDDNGGDDVTLALTNVIGGSAATTATFDADDETLVLISAATKWVVLAEAGVTLS